MNTPNANIMQLVAEAADALKSRQSALYAEASVRLSSEEPSEVFKALGDLVLDRAEAWGKYPYPDKNALGDSEPGIHEVVTHVQQGDVTGLLKLANNSRSEAEILLLATAAALAKE